MLTPSPAHMVAAQYPRHRYGHHPGRHCPLLQVALRPAPLTSATVMGEASGAGD
jgi:hypothetical protein